MPTAVLKDERTKMTTAKVTPSKGVDAYAVESARRALEQLGHGRIILRSDRTGHSSTEGSSEKGMRVGDRVGGGASERPLGQRISRERREERAGSAQSSEERFGEQSRETH